MDAEISFPERQKFNRAHTRLQPAGGEVGVQTSATLVEAGAEGARGEHKVSIFPESDILELR